MNSPYVIGSGESVLGIIQKKINCTVLFGDFFSIYRSEDRVSGGSGVGRGTIETFLTELSLVDIEPCSTLHRELWVVT